MEVRIVVGQSGSFTCMYRVPCGSDPGCQQGLIVQGRDIQDVGCNIAGLIGETWERGIRLPSEISPVPTLPVRWAGLCQELPNEASHIGGYMQLSLALSVPFALEQFPHHIRK